jgi:methylated-DNA-protein-cysteine methyltransferase-like protein
LGVEPRWERFYEVIRRIPRGRVATYGQIASLAGLPRHARQVGYALHALAENSDVPWHRVINARGEVSARSTPGWDELQLALLRRERVVGRDGRIDLDRFQWEPGD